MSPSLMGPEESSARLREYLVVLRVRKWSVLLLTALAAGSALVFALRQTPVYVSRASILVKPTAANQVLLDVPSDDLVDLETEREILHSTAVATIAAEDLGPSARPEALLRHLSVSVPEDTQILTIAYSDTDPQAAQRAAQAFADAYLRFRTTRALEAYTRLRSGLLSQIRDLEAELDKVEGRLASAPPESAAAREAGDRLELLTGQIAFLRNQLAPLTVLDIDPGEVIEPATLPGSPSSPNVPVEVALGLLVGLGLGVGQAFLRERLDDGLRGRADLEERAEAAVLAVIPKVPDWRRREDARLVMLEAPKSAAAEAYRTLRTSLQFVASQAGAKVVMVTSPSQEEGKTTTAANLAVALAQADKRVILVSADLRKPRVHRFFGIENGPGVVDVLLGEVGALAALRESDAVANLRLLPSGSIPGSPAELLQSEQMGDVLSVLREAADFVLLDSAPVLPVADSLALGSLVDGILLVADAGTSTRGTIAHAREQLDQMGVRVLGAVLNAFDPARGRPYSYHHRYYLYGYGHHRETREAASRQWPDGLPVP